MLLLSVSDRTRVPLVAVRATPAVAETWACCVAVALASCAVEVALALAVALSRLVWWTALLYWMVKKRAIRPKRMIKMTMTVKLIRIGLMRRPRWRGERTGRVEVRRRRIAFFCGVAGCSCTIVPGAGVSGASGAETACAV